VPEDKTIIVTRLDGGLGNQMFQYAIGRVLSLDRGVPLYVDIGSYSHYSTRKYALGVFNISAQIATPKDISIFTPTEGANLKNFVRRLAQKSPTMLVLAVKNLMPHEFSSKLGRRLSPESKHYYRENKEFIYDHTVLAEQPPLYLDGYWQNEKYFVGHRETILRDFTLRAQLSEKAKTYQNMIQNHASVSLHIRRGDYVHVAAARKLYDGVCDLEYYGRALEFMKQKIPDLSVFVFSDEIAWAKAHLRHEHAIYVEGCADFEEMYLMSCCRHNIIANSSFSWWGAWLNANAEKIVVAPRRWHKSGDDNHTPIPETWMRV
jgi:hypothetical protein